MNALMSWLGGELCRHLMTALAHTLWQGALLAALLYAYLRRTPATAVNKRYGIAVLALAAVVLGGLLTFSILNYHPPVKPAVTDGGTTVVTHGSNNTSATAPSRPQDGRAPISASPPARWHAWATGLWLLGVLAMLTRALAVVLAGDRLRRQCVPLEDAATLALIEQLRRTMRIGRRIRVTVCERLPIPGVVGCLWPTLLLPAAMLSGVPADDLRAILAHELAHIRRFDYLVNFGQMVVEALLFFNPAVWWISRQIRIEREACCDAAAVELTGHKIQYAEALISWARRLRDQRVTATAAIVGLADDPHEGRLLDRIRRLVVAGHRPKLRVSWPAAFAMVVLSALALLVLNQGTDLAVALAGRILTPQQRIDKITEITEEYSLPDRKYGEQDKVLVSGTLRTYDGQPFANHPRVSVQSNRPRYGTSVALSVRTKDQPVGTATFNQRIEYGRMYVAASAEGYAPAFAGPFEPEPGGHIEGIELVLEEGFPTRIRVVDEHGRPVADAEIVGGYEYREDGSYRHTIELTTDQHGLATEEHAGEYPASLRVAADGFEPEQVKGVELKQNEITTVTLRPVKPAAGIVVSKVTGEPIAGATIRLMFSEVEDQTYYENDMHGAADAITEEDGRFTLARLRRERRYLALIQADGYQPEYFRSLQPGDIDVTIALDPRRPIQGKILGVLDRLDTDKNGVPCVRYSNRCQLNNHSQCSATQSCPVSIANGVGTFAITDFYGQQVDITAGDKSLSVNTEEDDLDNVVIDLASEDKVMREVVLTFKTPLGSPPMQGGIRIYSGKSDWIDVVDGQARCTVAAPCGFRYKIDYNQGKRPVGYWFRTDPNTIDIPPGEGPFTIEVPVHPAGAIYGRILEPDGRIAPEARASLIVVERPDVVGTSLHDLGDALYGGGVDRGRFNATPLPLGGVYAVAAHLDNYFQVTDPLHLDAAHAIIEHDIQLGEGVTLTGRLIDSDGSPARDKVQLGASVKLEPEGRWSMRNPEIRPDTNGAFAFDNVNPRFSGRYIIHVTVRPGYHPIRHEVKDATKPVVIQLEKFERLKGVVIDADSGWPVPGAEVEAHYQDSGRRRTLYAQGKTNERGEFIFSDMTARLYQLSVRDATLLVQQSTVSVTGGRTDPVVLRVKIPPL